MQWVNALDSIATVPLWPAACTITSRSLCGGSSSPSPLTKPQAQEALGLVQCVFNQQREGVTGAGLWTGPAGSRPRVRRVRATPRPGPPFSFPSHSARPTASLPRQGVLREQDVLTQSPCWPKSRRRPLSGSVIPVCPLGWEGGLVCVTACRQCLHPCPCPAGAVGDVTFPDKPLMASYRLSALGALKSLPGPTILRSGPEDSGHTWAPGLGGFGLHCSRATVPCWDTGFIFWLLSSSAFCLPVQTTNSRPQIHWPRNRGKGGHLELASPDSD